MNVRKAELAVLHEPPCLPGHENELACVAWPGTACAADVGDAELANHAALAIGCNFERIHTATRSRSSAVAIPLILLHRQQIRETLPFT
jgi:hypothetical protein